VWDWVSVAVVALLAQGYTEAQLAGSSASLIERLRVGLEQARDVRAEAVFMRQVAEGRIESRCEPM
jgi:hypothetical protein